MLRWDEATGVVTGFRQPSNYANGNTRDRQGRLVTCEHLTRRVTRTERDGSVTVLIDRFDGKPLNAPNDVVVASDGSVWFTDPGYGIMSDYEGRRAVFALPTAVYRLSPGDGGAEPVILDLDRPNGLCFAPDESRLYVVDSGSPGGIHVYEVADGQVDAGRPFVDMAPGGSDGIRCDTDGNLWAAAVGGGDGFDGVHVFAPTGPASARSSCPRPAPTSASAAPPATGCSWPRAAPSTPSTSTRPAHKPGIVALCVSSSG
jgi:gluconolactonase